MLETVICGETEIPTDRFVSEVEQLEQYNPESHSTGMGVQFQLLSQVTPDPDEVFCITARSNPNKNRSDKFLPRMCLMCVFN